MSTVIAILIAVMVDRYVQVLPAGQILVRARSTSWLNLYLVKCLNILERIGIKQNYLIILSAFLPICIALFLIKLLFGILLGNLGSLIFISLALFYFLGNRQKDEQHPSPFVVAHEQSFGVLFWFAVLGPTGALLYWFCVISKQMPIILDPVNDNLLRGLTCLHAMVAWIPARITGFIYALVGNFDPGFKCWLQCVRNPKLASSQVLQDCGQAAIGTGSTGDDERSVTRAFIAWVVLIVLIVLYVR